VFLFLALAIALFPKKLPRAAQRAMAAPGSGEPESWTRERSFRGKKLVLFFVAIQVSAGQIQSALEMKFRVVIIIGYYSYQIRTNFI
jgi:hypothetical protein